MARPGHITTLVALVTLTLACGGAGGMGCSIGFGRDDPPGQLTWGSDRTSEAILELYARCDQCAWETPGREAVMLRITVDGRYVAHLPVARPAREQYRVMLGRLTPGPHVVRADLDSQLTAEELRTVGPVVEAMQIDAISEGDERYLPLSLAPFVYARPDTVGRFNDAPLFMWYEIEPEANATRYRFSVIFTNEDGGTPTDRLMATWGRTTDIEYLYSVAVDANGVIVDQDMQGPEHETLKYSGAREAQHPLLWVSTRNNMVLDRGETQVRFGPAPIAFSLANRSREFVMDSHAWLYDVMTRELRREGKIVPDAPAGQDRIPDPRRFVFLEGCGEAGDRAVAFAIGTGAAGGELTWHASDRGRTEYRIVRNGCFQAATPLPGDLTLKDVRAVRAQAHPREKRDGTAPARLTRINQLFMLDDGLAPGPSALSWQGSALLEPGAPPFEIAVIK